MDANEYFILHDLTHFTSVGPLVLEGYTFAGSDTIFSPGDIVRFKLSLKNNGLGTTARDIRVSITCPDFLAELYNNSHLLSDIAPGSTIESRRYYSIAIQKDCPENIEIPIDVNIGWNGHTYWHDAFSVKVVSTGIAEIGHNVPSKVELFQNYPNPFNPTTTLGFSLAQTSRVRMDIYNTSGQLIETVVDRIKPAGVHQVLWNAHHHPSGAYFCRLTAKPIGDGETFTQTHKLLLLK